VQRDPALREGGRRGCLPEAETARWRSKRGAFRCKQAFRRSWCDRRSTMLKSKKKSGGRALMSSRG
jgi:hypothetical protein